MIAITRQHLPPTASRAASGGAHVGELTGIPAAERPIEVEAITIHRIAEESDALGLLQQISAGPAAPSFAVRDARRR